jgi:hypothetical protein
MLGGMQVSLLLTMSAETDSLVSEGRFARSVISRSMCEALYTLRLFS